jgi:hypothetical protein
VLNIASARGPLVAHHVANSSSQRGLIIADPIWAARVSGTIIVKSSEEIVSIVPCNSLGVLMFVGFVTELMERKCGVRVGYVTCIKNT